MLSASFPVSNFIFDTDIETRRRYFFLFTLYEIKPSAKAIGLSSSLDISKKIGLLRLLHDQDGLSAKILRPHGWILLRVALILYPPSHKLHHLFDK